MTPELLIITSPFRVDPIFQLPPLQLSVGQSFYVINKLTSSDRANRRESIAYCHIFVPLPVSMKNKSIFEADVQHSTYANHL